MAEFFIRDRYRVEFEEAGLEHVKRTLYASNYSDPEKIRHARAWIDEKEHGEERAHRAEQLRLQRRADLKSTITTATSVIAILLSAAALVVSLVALLRK